MPAFAPAPTARRALALTALTGALSAPAAPALAAGPLTLAAPPDRAAPTLLAPVPLTVPFGAGHLHDARVHAAGQLAKARHDGAVRDMLRTARHAARLRGQPMPAGLRARLEHRTVRVLQAERHRLRLQLHPRHRYRSLGAPAAAIPAQLSAIAACESGGNPAAVGGGGAFRGKYQFTYATWAAVGGQGDPAAAPVAEQDRRAAMLYAQSGPGQWPVCGR